MVRRALFLVTALRWALEDCAGLPLFKQALLAAQRGGIEEFYIVARESARLQPLLKDPRFTASFRWVEETLPEDLLKSDSALVIKAETVFDAKVVEAARHWELDGEVAHLVVRKGKAERGTSVRLEGERVAGLGEGEADAFTAGILLVRPEALSGIAPGGNRDPITFPEIIRHLTHKGTVKAVNVSKELCQEVTSLDTLKEAVKALYGRLGLPTDGPMSVHLNRKLSGLLTRLLIRLPITPNQITLCGCLIGLVACWFFWHGGYWHGVFAALIYYTSVIVDMSDGEVARLKFMQSRLGAWLDSICDSIVYAGIFIAIALALSQEGHAYVLWAGLAAATAAFICLNLDPYLFPPSSTEKPSWLTSVDTFQIALFLLIFSGKWLWFIWGMAAGWTCYLAIFLLRLLARWLKRGHAAA